MYSQFRAIQLENRYYGDADVIFLFAECNRDADITFMLDVSSSVNNDNFKKMKRFVSDLVELINVDGDASNVAVMTFGDTPMVSFGLDRYDTRFDIQQAIETDVTYRRGSTNTAAALDMLRTEVYRYAFIAILSSL